MNNNFIRGNLPFDDAGFHDMLKATNLTTLRYPGGTSGSLFDWETNQFVPNDILLSYGPKSWHRRHLEMKKRIAQAPPNTFSANNFAAMCKTLDIEPVWIPNPVTVTPQSNIKFFEHLKANNIPCNFVEMGNECGGHAFRRIFPKGSDYANAIRPVMKRIKEISPQAKIAVVANGHRIAQMKKSEEEQESGSANARGETWNDMLMADRQYFDAIVLHSYGVSPTQLRKYQPNQWQSLILAFPGAYMDAAADRSRRLYHATPIWLSEYNAAFHHLMEARVRQHDAAEDYFGKVSDSPMHGLMIASYMIGAINDPQIWPIINYHSLTGPKGFRLVRRNEGDWRMGPKIQIFSYLAQLIRESQTMYPVNIQNADSLNFTCFNNDKPISTLAAAALENDQQRHWLIMNRSNQTQTVRIPWQQSDKATIRTIAGTLAPKDPQTMWTLMTTIDTTQTPWDKPLTLKPVTAQRNNKQPHHSLSLEPHSLTVVSMPR
ncbi:MAG: hypothetical protein JKX85_16450 [Phycisphaeraceae bacterium]|nr:hypothetical protein [Phycisphaeraceae bacterium]